jgi:hypothetical protein
MSGAAGHAAAANCRSGEELTAMAGGVIASAALAVAEKEVPVILKALAPEVQALFAELPIGSVKVVPPSIDVEVAVAWNLQRALPAFNTEICKTIRRKVGIAVAIYATEHLGDSLQSDEAWMDIQSLSLAAIAEEGLDTSKIPRSTLRQLVSSGIELYRAGAGVKALDVRKD